MYGRLCIRALNAVSEQTPFRINAALLRELEEVNAAASKCGNTIVDEFGALFNDSSVQRSFSCYKLGTTGWTSLA